VLISKKCKVKLILMDINLGENTMNGLQATQAIRQFEQSEKLTLVAQVIAHTCDEPEILKENILYRHMDDMSYKPMSPENMIKCLKKFRAKTRVSGA